MSTRHYQHVIGSDSVNYYHESEGVVFLRTTSANAVHYHDAQQDAFSAECIMTGLEGDESPAFYNALVRRGKPGMFHYYPLPLIFASEEERRIAADVLHKRPPPERWARRRRESVIEAFELITQD